MYTKHLKILCLYANENVHYHYIVLFWNESSINIKSILILPKAIIKDECLYRMTCQKPNILNVDTPIIQKVHLYMHDSFLLANILAN